MQRRDKQIPSLCRESTASQLVIWVTRRVPLFPPFSASFPLKLFLPKTLLLPASLSMFIGNISRCPRTFLRGERLQRSRGFEMTLLSIKE